MKTKKELKLLKVIGQHADQNQNVKSQFSFNHSGYGNRGCGVFKGGIQN